MKFIITTEIVQTNTHEVEAENLEEAIEKFYDSEENENIREMEEITVVTNEKGEMVYRL